MSFLMSYLWIAARPIMIMSLSRIVANYILRLALSSLAVLMMVIMRTIIDIVHTTSHAIIVVVTARSL